MDSLGISVVICCYNSAERLPKVLEHLSLQDTKPTTNWEVLVIDNASKDNTAEIALQLWNNTDIPIRVIHEPNPGLSNARRAGIQESKYSFISFIDDDNWVENLWVQKIYEFMINNPQVGILGGKGEVTVDSDKPFWFDTFQRSYAVGQQSETSGQKERPLYGAGFTLRKDAWDYLHKNGFEFILSDRKGKSLSSGGDSELCLAIILAGYQLYYKEDLTFKHYMPAQRLTWEYLVTMTKSFGRTKPVLHVYYSIIGQKKGIRRLRYQNRWVSVIDSLYVFILKFPPFAKLLFFEKTGKKEVIDYYYAKYCLIEALSLINTFPGIVNTIKNGKWINTRKINQ